MWTVVIFRRSLMPGDTSMQPSMTGVLVFVLLFSTAPVNADDEKVRARWRRVLWSAFQCATFAEMSGDGKEQERLFEVGFKAGRQFVEAVNNRRISPDAVRSEVPIGVTMLLAGPSTDFIIGRIFENAVRDAYNEIAKKDGALLDQEVIGSNARHKYVAKNCALIQ
jgi:hypothetical protein